VPATSRNYSHYKGVVLLGGRAREEAPRRCFPVARPQTRRAVKRIDAIFKVEREISGHPLANASPRPRRAARCRLRILDAGRTRERGNSLMTDEQATYLKNLSEQAFEPEAFKRNLDVARRRAASPRSKPSCA
jgi:hypothetical protein